MKMGNIVIFKSFDIEYEGVVVDLTPPKEWTDQFGPQENRIVIEMLDPDFPGGFEFKKDYGKIYCKGKYCVPKLGEIRFKEEEYLSISDLTEFQKEAMSLIADMMMFKINIEKS